MSSLRIRIVSSALVIAAASLGACSKTDAPPTGFGVNVTVDATAVAASVRAKITTAKLKVVSDKSATVVTRTLSDVPKAIQGGTVRFHYTPGSDVKAGDMLTFGLDLTDGADIVAAGSADPVTLTTGAVAVTIKVEGLGDGGVTTDDGGNVDGNAGEVINPTGKHNGVACITDDECGTGFCTDGVCCNERCKDVCASCSAGTKGVCSAYGVDTDPENECGPKIAMAPVENDAGTADAGAATPDAGESDALVLNTPDGGIVSMPTTCGGKCGGARSCKFPDSTKSCGKPFCNSSKDIVSFTCDGNGGCVPDVSTCTSYACDPSTGACKTQCGDTSDCLTGKYCNGTSSMCAPKKGNGISCVNALECGSGNCVGSVCCNVSCDGPGLSCTDGQCKCPGVTCAAGVSCQVFFQDADGDGYGNKAGIVGATSVTAKAGCTGAPPSGYVADSTDCDDGDPNVHPGQTMYFGTPSLGTAHTYDYNCDGATQKETPEYPGGSCKFCGAVGSCDTTSTACTSTSQTGSFQCPQEGSGGIIRAQSEVVPTPAPLAAGAPSISDPIISYASSVPGGAAAVPILPPPICQVCILQCCGCAAGDKTGFRQVVACGNSSVSQYTCGSCAAVGGAPSMTASFKQQRCR